MHLLLLVEEFVANVSFASITFEIELLTIDLKRQQHQVLVFNLLLLL